MQNLDVSTIIIAILAIFVVWKLRSVLGTRNGAERPPFDAAPPGAAKGGSNAGQGPGNVIQLPGAARVAPQQGGAATPNMGQRWKGYADPGTTLWAGLDAIGDADRGFSAEGFLAGARSAYEMIVTAFAAGDKKTLGGLLASDVMDNFAKAINARLAAGQTMTTTLVSIDAAKLVDAKLNGAVAQLSVRFAAKLISATRDKSGAVIEGSAEAVADHLDIWTFARDVGSRNPNWLLTATETMH